MKTKWEERQERLATFKLLLKEKLPQTEQAMVSDEGSAGMYVTVHNGFGGLRPTQRWLNKMSLFGQSGVFKVRNTVARTDLNYQDAEYIELIRDIVELCWAKVWNNGE